MRRYGQGNGPTRQRTLRVNRRMAAHSVATPEREMGNRPGIARVLGIVDPSVEGPPEPIDHDMSACTELGCRVCLDNQHVAGGIR